MRKFDGIESEHVPDVFYSLPELAYPEKFNAVKALIDPISENNWEQRPAYYFRGKTITYDELRNEVFGYASAFRSAGISVGDKVLLHIEDRPELIYSILALQVIGAIAVPTYVQLKPTDLLYRAEDAGTKFLLMGDNLMPGLDNYPETGKFGKLITVPGNDTDGHLSVSQLRKNSTVKFEYANTHRDDIALLLYTSGSSGRPKGTCHSHADLLAICDTYCRHCIGLTPDDVIGSPAAIPFALGYGIFSLFTIRFGASALLEPNSKPEQLVPLFQKHHVTVMAAVSTYYRLLTNHMEQTDQQLPSLRMSLVGGEPLPLETSRSWNKLTKLQLEQFLGTTELLHIFLSARHGIDPPKEGAIGTSVPGYEISVRDPETFLPVPDCEHGLLCVRGATGTAYLNRLDAQQAAVRDGWNIFQDIVKRDEDGYIYHISRYDDAIISAGYTISANEVENVLITHPHVLECGCVAAPDPKKLRTTIVKAFIVLRSGKPGAELCKEIQGYFKSKAPPYMYPREIEFVDQLPKTINGKILRSELRKRGVAAK